MMEFLLAPTRQELLAALRFPAIMAPFLLVFIRYRFLWSYVASGSTDGAEAWRLSGYLTALFVFVAYPISLSKYDDWFWTTHSELVLLFILFWLSLAGWTLVRHFLLQGLADEKLQKDLESISSGLPPRPAIVSPAWLRTWGWANCIGFVFLVALVGRVVGSLQ
jgi:hypothetical protein